MLNLKHFIVYLFLGGLSYATIAQEYTLEVKEFDVEDGLATRYFQCTFEDQTGFIWIVSEFGLDRFDGTDFKHYPVQKKGRVVSAHEGPDNLIWIHREYLWQTDYDNTRKEQRFSIHIFDPKSGIDTALEDYLPYALPFKVHQVSAITATKNGHMLLGTIDGRLYELGKESYSLRYKMPNNAAVNQLIEVNDGFWIVLSHEIIKLDPSWKALNSIPHENVDLTKRNLLESVKHHSGHSVFSPVQDQANQLHILTFDPAFGLEGSTKYKLKKRYSINGIVKKPYQVPFKYDVFAIDPTTLFQYVLKEGPQGETSIAILNNDGSILAEHQIPLNDIFAYFFDSQNNLWADTNSGILLIKLKKSPFKKLLTDLKTDYGITHASRGIAQINDTTIVIGGAVYPYKVDLRNGSYQQFTSIHQTLAIKAIDSSVWIGGERPFIYQIDLNTNSTVSFDYANKFNVKADLSDSVLNGAQWSIHKDRYGTLWTGSYAGLSIINTQSQELNNVGEVLPFSKAKVFDIHENDKGLWLATEQGIYLFDPIKKHILERYHTAAIQPHRLPHNSFTDIYEDANGTFWLASDGGGLIKWNPYTGEQEQFTTENGLSHNEIYAVYEDHNQNLWIPSFLGINQFNKETENVSYYLTKDGISHNEFNRISHYRGFDSTLYFGGQNGVTSFHPKDFPTAQETETTSLVITELSKRIKQDGTLKEALIELEETNSITLSSSETGLFLKFRLLNFDFSNDTRYAYKIEGIDADWIYQSESSLNINKLPYGSHKFMLIAKGEKGLWTAPVTFQLTVIRPFYIKTWFILLCVFVVSGLIYLLFYLRNRNHLKNEQLLKEEVAIRTGKIEKQALELKKLDAAKSQFFANISHELRTPLSLILGPTEQLIKDKQLSQAQLNQLNRMYRNGKSLSNLVEEILELSKLEAGKLEVYEAPTMLKPFLNRIHSAYQSLAIQKGITYNCELNFFDQAALYLDTGKLEKVINNLLSNALKFTKKDGFVKLSVFLEKEIFRISVEDSGSGIATKDLPSIFDRFYQSQIKDKSGLQGGTGIGLALAKELTEVMGGNIRVESTVNEGSYFEVILPKKEAQASDILSEELVEDLITHIPKVERNDYVTDNQEFKLLLVEDNQDMRDHISELLSPDYNIIVAKNGKIALEQLKKESIDLVITDVMMPEMNGFTLLNLLKSNNLYRGLPVIMLTALAEDDDRLNALTIGVDDYMTKPFLADELKARVKNLLINYKNRVSSTELGHNDNKESLVSSSIISSEAKVASQADLDWVKEVEKEALKRLTDIDFSMDILAASQHITARHLQRKIKKITGLRPNQYIQELRLQLSRSYLERKAFPTVNEVTKAVGFQSSKYFSKLFKERFGKSPSAYLN